MSMIRVMTFNVGGAWDGPSLADEPKQSRSSWTASSPCSRNAVVLWIGLRLQQTTSESRCGVSDGSQAPE